MIRFPMSLQTSKHGPQGAGSIANRVKILLAVAFIASHTQSLALARWTAAPRASPPRQPRTLTLEESLQRQLTKQLADSTSAKQVLEVLEAAFSSTELNHYHIGAAFTRLAKSRRTFDRDLQGSPVVSLLVNRTMDLLEGGDMNAQASVNVLMAIASLGPKGNRTRGLIEPLATNLVAQAPTLNSWLLANSFWSGATLQNLQDRQRVALLSALMDLAEELPRVAEELKAQDVANIMWASARLEEITISQKVMPTLIEEVPRVAQDLTAQGVSNILWAGATLRRKQELKPFQGIVPILRSRAVRTLKAANQQDVANSVWALALLDGSDEGTGALEAFVPIAAQLSWQMKPQELANTCFGFALRGVQCIRFLDDLADNVLASLKGWSVAERRMSLPVIAWTYAKLAVEDPPLFQSIAIGLQGQLEDLTDWSLCALAWSLTKLDTSSPLLPEVNQELARRGFGPDALQVSGLGLDEFRQWLRGPK